LYEKRDGTCGIHGVDLSTYKAVIVSENDKYLAMYQPGRTYFGGIGTRSYAPPEVTIYRKVGKWRNNKSGSREIDIDDSTLGVIQVEMPRGWIKDAYGERAKLAQKEDA
jgi:hypothetical protein